jgi:Domain of unknown function (DUF4465)/Secretion system C-terminal sorting domain
MISKITTAFAICFSIATLKIKAQTSTQVSDFEDWLLPANSYVNGSASPMVDTGFADGSCYFPTFFDSSFGLWDRGYALTNMVDTVNPGFTNLYGCAAGKGYNGSNNYISVQPFSYLLTYSKLKVLPFPTGSNNKGRFDGMYVTNSFYAYSSMKNGDFLETKFGDTSGNRPDYFKLVARGFLNGTLKNDSATFYLADFRFVDNSQDYIVKNWTWFNCEGLGIVDSVYFEMRSSRNGQFGMNTPAFFAIDNVTISYGTEGVGEISEANMSIYPNPAKDVLTINTKEITNATATIMNIDGHIVSQNKLASSVETIDISAIANGLYLLEIKSNAGIITRKFAKE